MRTFQKGPGRGIFFISLLLATVLFGFAAKREQEVTRKAMSPALVQFIKQKRALTEVLAEKHQIKTPGAVWTFFNAAERGDWLATSNLYRALTAHSENGVSELPRPLAAPLKETVGAFEQFETSEAELLKKFAGQIIDDLPADSIYFGGTDAGRFVVSAFCQSHTQGRPFFTVTQNALADWTYLDYLRDIYGRKLSIPTPEEAQQAFQDYLQDAQRRLASKQLKEDEEISLVEGKAQVSGTVAVMQINERLLKRLIEKNPSHEVFIEESFPLESLNARYLPHGLVLKISREPVERLPDSVIEKDHQFWTAEVRSLIGSSLKEAASIPQLCATLEAIYVRSDESAFDGNRAYLKDTQAPQYFSKCRSSIARVYQWRSQNARKSDAAALINEADFAHRQAYALAPFNAEEAWLYSSFLLEQKRTNDAKAILATTLKINPSKSEEFNAHYFTNSLAKLRKKAQELDVKTR
ncbi:MAG: hypothetical protein JWM68_1583 [Verrucomicrobiales bacterium]|nr:hypothetical protein [Verrucomicrobiales bacterium]